jgi:O6-methylguanine-DNA--protein-cysteine methyltransferase
MKNKNPCEIELRKLKEENEELKEVIAIALNKPLLKELNEALVRIECGEYITEKEFAKRFNLTID